MKLGAYWSALPPYGKALFFLSIGVGLALLVVGVTGDYQNWWDGRNFATNILTSLVGALFGVPLAVVVIGWFTATHLDRLQVEETTTVTEDAWAVFREAALRTCSENLAEGLYDDAAAVDRAALTLIDRLKQHQEANGVSPTNIYDDVSELADSQENSAAITELGELAHNLQDATRRVRMTIGEREQWHREWVTVRLRWTFISTEVRRLRHSQRLVWIPPELEVDLTALVDDSSPVARLSRDLDLYEEFADILDNNLVLGLEDALAPREYFRVLSSIRVSPLTTSCMSALQIMGDLRWAIENADRSTWRSPIKVR